MRNILTLLSGKAEIRILLCSTHALVIIFFFGICWAGTLWSCVRTARGGTFDGRSLEGAGTLET